MCLNLIFLYAAADFCYDSSTGKPKDRLFMGEEWQSECEPLRSFILACCDLFIYEEPSINLSTQRVLVEMGGYRKWDQVV